MKALAIVLALAAVALATPSMPNFPSRYYIEFTFGMPNYPAVAEPVQVWYDGVGMNEVVSYYGGMDMNVFLSSGGKHQQTFQVNPMGSTSTDVKMTCVTSGINLSPYMYSALPASLESFVYVGQQQGENGLVDVWQYNDTQAGAATNNYTFLIDSETQAPVQYIYIGFSGSAVGFAASPNYDYFTVNYGTYIPGYYNASVFVVPPVCKNAKRGTVTTARQLAHRFGGDVKDRNGDALFAEYTALHGKTYRTRSEAAKRKAVFLKNMATISQLNVASQSKTVYAANHLADRTPEEMASRRMRPRKFTGVLPADANEHVKSTKSRAELPATFDWRNTPGYSATTINHEQGDCGSCWTFGASGSFAGTYFVKHGVMLDFSKQVLMDCTWQEGNQACNGGTPGSAYKGIMRLGGWPLEADYPYLMNDGKCKAFTSNYTIAKPVDVTPMDQHALMDALVTQGPIAVAVDAAPPAWNFYHSGVATMPGCNSHSLDHEVLLVGYTADAWIILNSWSDYWGQNGFLYISQAHNLCGVETSPQYAVPN
eukprot:c2649_g1_i1.p1 GENE.c2649_g1_i1~~c2649_g1_i1.p1  ORF type:complete len:548 (+),score=125.15 c2649_g1_i1:30-1646(+)